MVTPASGGMGDPNGRQRLGHRVWCFLGTTMGNVYFAYGTGGIARVLREAVA